MTAKETTALLVWSSFDINPIQMGFFGAAYVWGRGEGQKAPPLPRIFHTYPTIRKLGAVIPYLKMIQKIYESLDTPREFC